MKRIVSLTPKERQLKGSRFLTKRSSWVKLGLFLCLVVVLVWFGFKPDNHSKKQVALNDKNGKVAGIESTRPAKDLTNNPNTATPNGTINDHVSGGGDSDTVLTTDQIDPNPPVISQISTQTKAEIASLKLIGNSDNFELILEQGQQYLAKNKLSQADTLFTRATEIEPEYRDAWYLLGYTQLKEYEAQNKNNISTASFAQKAFLTLTRAHTIDPQAKNVSDLLAVAKEAAQV